ncbi:riboflavin biosynthesis protein RibD [Croceivirga lutea]|nr:bifunctional diaminohydroxyphosphoribosylaminopyrimidine deaminase/5-amino-6-(5-phosphoribosylamino)uracil reductase RibD [Croceivirga lutea]GGG47007.1 riboflavin biosynthesis protein RibD [Croceivirga lutea]
MQRALELGKNALGSAAPNPMVGCVIVHNQHIIGEGFTSAFGGPHAEVNAINAVSDKSLLSKATLYVTLEPCSHFGKTPPCADLIATFKIPRVVIGLIDPNKKVAGKGIEKLKSYGCELTVGVLEAECRFHHRRFLTMQEKKRPFVILKWAETTDGFIAPLKEMRRFKPEPFWITTKKSRQLVHKWRSKEMSILAGTTTVLEDNPKLNVRDYAGKAPLKLIIDKSLKIPSSAAIYNDNTKVIVFNNTKSSNFENSIVFKQLEFTKNIPSQILQFLYEFEISSVFIEGGAKTIQSFIDANLWDEARVFKGKSNFGEGTKAPVLVSKSNFRTSVLQDQLYTYYND